MCLPRGEARVAPRTSDGDRMNVCHGVWLPFDGADFENGGRFVFWVETRAGQGTDTRLDHLKDAGALKDFLCSEMGFSGALMESLKPEEAAFHAALPSSSSHPLPSPEMAWLTGDVLSDEILLKTWEIRGLSVDRPLMFLREIQFAADFVRPDLPLGGDLRFWIRYAHHLRTLLQRHQFLPVMMCRASGKRKADPEIHAGWSPAAALYERGLKDFTVAMPDGCRMVSDGKRRDSGSAGEVEGLSAIDLLRHFSEEQTDRLVRETPITKRLHSLMGESWPAHALTGAHALTPDHWQKWKLWHSGILGLSGDGSSGDVGFTPGIRLHQLDESDDDAWRLSFFAACARDPSLMIDLAEWWLLPKTGRGPWLKRFGSQFERGILVSLGQAARICPLLWDGMETAKPTGLDIDLQAAYGFLKDDVAVLEAAGFRSLVPAWWTPQGRRRARIRISASGRSGALPEEGGGYFDLPSLVSYRYDPCIGGEVVSEAEWQALIDARKPLVRFRGEWVELDLARMGEMLELWRQKDQSDEIHSIGDMLRDVAEVDDQTMEFAFDEVLGDILERVSRSRQARPVKAPSGLRARLRGYQEDGLSWLASQEAMGLNPCLADDMGLGKTLQVIALLLHERERCVGGDGAKEDRIGPTLLVAPTSVLSNWRREIEKFAPKLVNMIHHGSERITRVSEFASACAASDLVITSFTIARKDRKLLGEVNWKRIVVDEAQNIKNPKSAQARAICALEAPHRIALTGTPVENRLMDLWSLFNFLNPGYLGTAAQFRRAYETPIQRQGDRARSRQLQRLVQPFILRRLKTDRTIISELPDKVEQKVYCNLTLEQAALYEAVTRDVQERIEEAEGIQRKGLILSTLMRLKQICNHPAQFLQDGSDFAAHRSHKLTRLNEMIAEALERSDSPLVFTQFTEVGGRLETLLRETHACPVHYLHGGTSRPMRDRMIESFQDPDTPASIFILSLRAGGVGITLTRANHVFHFDRWWNPAVENQATDRAYRIGQQKTVFAHKMVTLGTLEERIDSMIEQKRALAESIVGADESWLTEMDNAAFRQLIELNRTAILEA